MKHIVLLGLFWLTGCSSYSVKEDGRALASVEDEQKIKYGDPDVSKSSIKLFPPELEGGMYKYYFYLELKNLNDHYIDLNETEIQILNSKLLPVRFQVNRKLVGRYYLIVYAANEIKFEGLSFFIRGQNLKGHFQLFVQAPVSDYSKIKLISQDRDKHEVKFQLYLRDQKNRPVSLTNPPEIILDSDGGSIDDLVMTQEGVWEFKIYYSEQNQLIYLSVRAQGVYFKDLYRFHHVEK